MALVVRAGGDYEPAPAGMHPAICIDVVDLGMVEGQYGIKPRIRIVWAIAKNMQDGRPYTAQRNYGRSLNRKATLRRDLETWRGRGFAESEIAKGFDLEVLIGKRCLLSIQHDHGAGQIWANVVAVLPLPPGMPAPTPDPNYVRFKDREGREGNGAPAPSQEPEAWGQPLPADEPPPPLDEDWSSTLPDEPESDLPF